MQLNSYIVLILLNIISYTFCAPTDATNTDIESPQNSANEPHNTDASITERNKVDYYEYRHVVAEGWQRALDECREKFKWDRWNCPKKVYLDILNRIPLPSNKELAYTRALIASSTVLSITRSCSYGTSNVCGCSQTTSVPAHANSKPGSIDHLNEMITMGSPTQDVTPDQNVHSTRAKDHTQIFHVTDEHRADLPPTAKFVWRGCDESVKFAFKVSKMYLESQDNHQDESSRRINAHNYEVGRLAVKKNMKRICKCHGISGSCQVNTCWTSVPDIGIVGEYLRRQYRTAAKVGAISALETNIVSLNKELFSIKKDKLVFADASPDYCYENSESGINGTLGRYCSKAIHRIDGSEVSRNERDSCDRLCTKCGYKIKRERLNVEKQCDCRFVYCCSVECKRCPHVEDAYKCVRHS